MDPEHPRRAAIAAFRGELLQTPWHNTVGFKAAKDGKCQLRLTGPSDPSCGRGHGLCYVRKESGRNARGYDENNFRIVRRNRSRSRLFFTLCCALAR